MKNAKDLHAAEIQVTMLNGEDMKKCLVEMQKAAAKLGFRHNLDIEVEVSIDEVFKEVDDHDEFVI